MENWMELTTLEYKEVWDRVYDDFKFEPSISDFPSFQVSKSFITYDVSRYLNESVGVDIYEEAYKDLEEKSLLVFQELTQNNEYMYALDWQHSCYWVNPCLEFPKREFDEWTVPIFPDGDYYFFIQKNFEWGLLGHPWERTITIFGEKLIEAFGKYSPKMFQEIVRQE